jgi:pimeloyl-ACP methyl ester carboxylesterase
MMKNVSVVVLLWLVAAGSTFADDGSRLLSVDHYVRVKSTAPAMAGADALLYVREVVLAGTALRSETARGVVLFVHGAGTPANVAFDSPHEDFSWMGYLARAGYDVFSVDMTGYGRSTRPPAMSDPCNIQKAQQAQFIPGLLSAPCAATHPAPITTMESDWNDIDAAVDHLRRLRHVETVSLVGWSQGGPRTGGYAARHPAKVSRLVVLAPAYVRAGPASLPMPAFPEEGSMTAQSQSDFTSGWDGQIGCADQAQPGTRAAVWADMLASDPVGATWSTGVRRAPRVPTYGFNQLVVSKLMVPALLVVGVYDKQVNPDRVRELYADLGSKQKVMIELACSSHNAMWEKNHLLLFRASLEWLRDGKVNGESTGELKLGN